MNLSYASSQARQNLYRLMDDVAESHQPVTIRGRRNNVVMLSESDYQAMQETLYILSVPGMRESILDASKEPLAKCTKASQVNWK